MYSAPRSSDERDALVLLVQSPLTLFAYWHLTSLREQLLLEHFGVPWRGLLPCLRFYDITGLARFDGSQALELAHAALPDGGSCFFGGFAPGRRYTADLGVVSAEGRFVALLRAQPVLMPEPEGGGGSLRNHSHADECRGLRESDGGDAERWLAVIRGSGDGGDGSGSGSDSGASLRDPSHGSCRRGPQESDGGDAERWLAVIRGGGCAARWLVWNNGCGLAIGAGAGTPATDAKSGSKGCFTMISPENYKQFSAYSVYAHRLPEEGYGGDT